MRAISAYSTIFCLVIGCSNSFADHIVLQSVSESYAEGDLLNDPTIVELSDGETLVLLSELGDVIDIAGPYSGQPNGTDADDFDLATALRSLIDNADNIHATLGSTRAAGLRIGQPGIRPMWTLDPLHSGAQCALEGRDVVFWRADTAKQQELIIQRPGFDGAGEISWKTGESVAPWPSSVSIVHGELYVIRRQGWMESALVYLALIPAAVGNNEEATTAWLAANGCRIQAEAIMQSIVNADSGTESVQ